MNINNNDCKNQLSKISSFNIDNVLDSVINDLTDKQIYQSKGEIVRNALIEFFKRRVDQKIFSKIEMKNKLKENLEYIEQNRAILSRINIQSSKSISLDIDENLKLNLQKMYSFFPYLTEYLRLIQRRLLIEKHLTNKFTIPEPKNDSEFIELDFNGEKKRFRIIRKN